MSSYYAGDGHEGWSADELPSMLEVMTEQLGALTRFVKAYADADPLDTTPVERQRLHDVHDLLAQSLDRFQ